MKGKIRLDARKASKTKKGYPIIFSLSQNGSKPVKTGYYSELENWDKYNALPTKKHPEYYVLLDYLQIKKVALKKLIEDSKLRFISLEEAEKILTNKTTGIFYKDAMNIIKDLGRPYKAPLNFFNKLYPNYPYESITSQVAEEFRDILIKTPVIGKGGELKERSSNGVLSYLDSLTSVWNKLKKNDINPFSGIKVKATPTRSKALTDQDLIAMRDNNGILKDKSQSICSHKKYIQYLLLCFYLGGIDLVDLKNLRYDKNVVNGRIEFTRSKGGTNVKVSNRIFPQALELLSEFDCKPYLVPLYKLKNYEGLISNMSKEFEKIRIALDLTKKPYSKAPRYTFITRAQNLLIDERCAMSLVGHSQSSIHSLYKDEFPQRIKDKAHHKIIDLSISSDSYDDF